MNKKMQSASKKSKPNKQAKTRSQRAPNLDDERILKIVSILDGWTGALTWDLFVAAIQANMGGLYARQTLDRHVRIKNAYQQTKERVSSSHTNDVEKKLTTKEIARRMADYDRLKNEVVRLENENNNYAKQFARWVWNLRQMKITEDQLTRLDNDLPKNIRS